MISEEQGRAIVQARADGRCEAAIDNVCLGGHDTTHHRRKRSHGGTWAPSNLLAVCGDGTIGCHGYIEAHPTFANERGLWLMAGEEPLEVSANIRWMHQRSWWLLDDEGMLTHETGADFEPITLSMAGPTSRMNFYRRAAR